jgi:hypothetical protein
VGATTAPAPAAAGEAGAAAAQAPPDEAPLPPLLPGGKFAPEGGQLGSFMYVRNSRFESARPSCDNPR